MKTLTRDDIKRGLGEVREKYKGKYPSGMTCKPKPDYSQIEIAFQWLDAQKYTKKLTPRYDLGEKMTDWSGSYISDFSLFVAAHIHTDIDCEYPSFNLGVNSIIPRRHRLEKLEEMNTIRRNQDKSKAKRRNDNQLEI